MMLSSRGRPRQLPAVLPTVTFLVVAGLCLAGEITYRDGVIEIAGFPAESPCTLDHIYGKSKEGDWKEYRFGRKCTVRDNAIEVPHDIQDSRSFPRVFAEDDTKHIHDLFSAHSGKKIELIPTKAKTVLCYYEGGGPCIIRSGEEAFEYRVRASMKVGDGRAERSHLQIGHGRGTPTEDEVLIIRGDLIAGRPGSAEGQSVLSTGSETDPEIKPSVLIDCASPGEFAVYCENLGRERLARMSLRGCKIAAMGDGDRVPYRWGKAGFVQGELLLADAIMEDCVFEESYMVRSSITIERSLLSNRECGLFVWNSQTRISDSQIKAQQDEAPALVARYFGKVTIENSTLDGRVLITASGEIDGCTIRNRSKKQEALRTWRYPVEVRDTIFESNAGTVFRTGRARFVNCLWDRTKTPKKIQAGWHVNVMVEDRDGKPIVGATIRFTPPAATPTDTLLGENDVRSGRVWTTDASGRIAGFETGDRPIVPALDGGFVVSAVSGGRVIAQKQGIKVDSDFFIPKGESDAGKVISLREGRDKFAFGIVRLTDSEGNTKPSFTLSSAAERAFVALADGDADAPKVTVAVRRGDETLDLDEEQIALATKGPGVFFSPEGIALGKSDDFHKNDGKLQAQPGDKLIVSYRDGDDGNDSSSGDVKTASAALTEKCEALALAGTDLPGRLRLDHIHLWRYAIRAFLTNVSDAAVKIKEVYVSGEPLTTLIGDHKKGYKLFWYRILSNPVEPGQSVCITIYPTTATYASWRQKTELDVAITCEDSAPITTKVSTTGPRLTFSEITFGEDRKTAYVYVEKEPDASMEIQTVYIDGNDVTARCTILPKQFWKDKCLVEIHLSDPLVLGSYHTYRVDADSGSFGYQVRTLDTFFPIGCYPGCDLKDYVAHACNFYIPWGAMGKENFAAFEKHGLKAAPVYAAVPVGGKWHHYNVLPPETRKDPKFAAAYEKNLKLLREAKDSPAFHMHHFNDEPDCRGCYGRNAHWLVENAELLRQIDPIHPLFLQIDNTHTWSGPVERNYYIYGDIADICATHKYSGSRSLNLFCADTMDKAARPKRVYALTKLCGSLDAMRIQMFYQLARGAKGLLHFTYAMINVEATRKAWDGMTGVHQQIHKIAPHLIVGDVYPIASTNMDELYIPDSCTEPQYRWIETNAILCGDGRIVVFLINNDFRDGPAENVELRVDLPPWLKVRRAYVVEYGGTEAEAEFSVEDGTLRMDFPEIAVEKIVALEGSRGE